MTFMAREEGMTMGLSLQDLNDRNAVFAELHRGYGQKRKWTAGELTYTVPSRKAHPVVPGWSICSMRVACAGDQRRAEGTWDG